ncbi:MAG: hypothetical protein RI952_932 [Bacteroidota bacterium]
MLASSCSTTRNFTEGQSLLNKYEITGIDAALKEKINPYIRQKPNRKLFGISKIRLTLYQLANVKHPGRISNLIQNNLGEAPVLYDSSISNISAMQIQQVLNSYGYFLAKVNFKDNTRHRKTTVNYQIELGKAYHIRNIQYSIKDSTIQSIYFYKLNESLLKIGSQYDQANLANERDRITKDLRNFGYYFFNREYIHFDIDTALKSNQLDLNVIIENPENSSKHQSYKLKNIEAKILSDQINDSSNNDAILLSKVNFINTNHKIHPKILRRMLFLEKDKKFNEDDLTLTYNRLGDLGIFKYINIDFEKDSIDSTLLNAKIQLSLAKRQSTNTELEGYVASENVGTSANFIYSNRNIFKGAEVFEFKIRAGLETQAFVDAGSSNIPVFNSRETNTSASITFPGFIFFRDKPTYVLFSNPKSRIGLNYISENRPEYSRRTLNSTFSYEWKQNNFVSHSLSPMTINYVNSNLSVEANNLLDSLNNVYLRESFEPHITLGLRYSVVISNQQLNQLKNYYYIKFNIEVMGTGLYGASILLNDKKNSFGQFEFFNLPYYNYTRPEIDLRYFKNYGSRSQLVYRFNTGIGFAYWNSKVLPFEKQFFTGGANSIRAFRARSVGPGGYNNIDLSSLNLDQTGNLKIEGNVEYRFDILERFIGAKLKGASFVDFGNVWDIKKKSSDIEGFNPSAFYKELAIGTGVGLRLDYRFLLFRFDLGLKVRDPRFENENRWVIQNINNSDWKNTNNYSFFNFNFGIGYPF